MLKGPTVIVNRNVEKTVLKTSLIKEIY